MSGTRKPCCPSPDDSELTVTSGYQQRGDFIAKADVFRPGALQPSINIQSGAEQVADEFDRRTSCGDCFTSCRHVLRTPEMPTRQSRSVVHRRSVPDAHPFRGPPHDAIKSRIDRLIAGVLRRPQRSPTFERSRILPAAVLVKLADITVT